MTTSLQDLSHNGRLYTALPGTIKRTSLGFHVHHRRVVAELGIDLPDSGYINTADYVLDERVPGTLEAEGSAYGMDYIMRILRAAGSDTWEGLKGRQVLVLFEAGSVDGMGLPALGIASLDGSRVLIFREHADIWKAREF